MNAYALATGCGDFGPRRSVKPVRTLRSFNHLGEVVQGESLLLLLLRWWDNEHKAPIMGYHQWPLFFIVNAFMNTLLDPFDHLKQLNVSSNDNGGKTLLHCIYASRVCFFRTLSHPIYCLPYGLKEQVKLCIKMVNDNGWLVVKVIDASFGIPGRVAVGKTNLVTKAPILTKRRVTIKSCRLFWRWQEWSFECIRLTTFATVS